MRECLEFEYLASAWGSLACEDTRGFPASPHKLSRIPARGESQSSGDGAVRPWP